MLIRHGKRTRVAVACKDGNRDRIDSSGEHPIHSRVSQDVETVVPADFLLLRGPPADSVSMVPASRRLLVVTI